MKLTKGTDFSSLGMDFNVLDYHCQIQPTRFVKEFNYEQICDDELSDENVSDDDDVEMENADEVEDEDRHKLSGVTGELLLKDHSESGLNVDENGVFALVTNATGKTKKVFKSAIVWYLNNDKTKLSRDRLHKVRVKD